MFLTFGFKFSYVWGLLFLRLGVSDSYVLWFSFPTFAGLVILTFGD